MLRSKAGLILRSVSAAIQASTRPDGAGTATVRIAASTLQNQLVFKSPISFSSSSTAENGGFADPTADTAPPDHNGNSEGWNNPHIAYPVFQEVSDHVDPADGCGGDAEKVVLLLSQDMGAEQLESELNNLNLSVTENLLGTVIKAPDVRTDETARFFQWAGRQPGYAHSPAVMNAMTRFLGRRGTEKELDLLRSLTEETAEHSEGAVTARALNALIHYLGRARRAKEALEVFQQFDKFKCEPSYISYLITIRALCAGSFFDEARAVLEDMFRTDRLPSIAESSKFIIRFCKAGKPKDAHLIYLKLAEKGRLPKFVAFEFLIRSLCKVAPEIAAETVKAFPEKQHKFAIKTYFTVIRSLCNKQRLDEAQALLSRMIEVGRAPDNAIFNTVITAFCKAEKLERAMTSFEQMGSRGLKPDTYTYNLIMSSLAKKGKMEEACSMLLKAKEAGAKHHSISYNILIDGFCRLGEFEKAQKYFSEMKESGSLPNVDSYTKLITAYCLKALDWRSAKKLLDEMVERKLSPSEHTRSLITAMKELEEEALQANAGHIKA